MTYGNDVTIKFRFWFVIVKYFLLRYNYVIYLFYKVTFWETLKIGSILVRSGYV